jgi:hypothetical protein
LKADHEEQIGCDIETRQGTLAEIAAELLGVQEVQARCTGMPYNGVAAERRIRLEVQRESTNDRRQITRAARFLSPKGTK